MMLSSDEPPSFYLYTDASPQLRGVEILATTLDIRWRGNWFRCLLPVVSLSRTMLDVVGKTIALVWQLFLLTGPSFTTLQKILDRVQSITTDMGAEQHVPESLDLLPEFYQALDPRAPADLPKGEYLFPNAIHSAGWQHCFDLVLQRGLSSLRFFPAYLATLKCLVSLLRNKMTLDAIVDGLSSAPAVAACIENLSLKNFAAWRWRYLDSSQPSLKHILPTLASLWDPTVVWRHTGSN